MKRRPVWAGIVIMPYGFATLNRYPVLIVTLLASAVRAPANIAGMPSSWRPA